MTRQREDKVAKQRPRVSAEIVPLPWGTQRKPRSKPKRQPVRAGDPDDYPISNRTLLAVGVFLALLIVSSVWLLETMRKNTMLEECLMAGRKNCAPPIAAPIVDR